MEEIRVPPIRNWRGVFLAGAMQADGLKLSPAVCRDIVEAIDELPEPPKVDE